MESLLSNISQLYNESIIDAARRTEQGEFFNIFNIIGLRSEEVRLHSAFIAELLNPKGSHGTGYRFLQAFLEIVGIPDGYLDLVHCSQNITERSIGRTTKTEGGRIDIIIEDGNHAVIIENKIYAIDQKNQLLRYHNYGAKHFPKGFTLIYLTLDGHDADSSSLGDKSIDYLTISYEHEIRKWLDKCFEIAEGKSLSQSVIKQYCELVKQLTYTDMDQNYKNKLMSLILKPENVISVGEILKVQEDWREELIEEYVWNPLEKYAQSKGMIFDKDLEYGGETGAWIYKKEWNYYALFIWTDRKYDWKDMYVGISWYEEPKRKNKICKKDYHPLSCLHEPPCDKWPYGWEYLPDEIRNWGYNITEQLVNGDVFVFIKDKFEEIIQELEEKELVMP